MTKHSPTAHDLREYLKGEVDPDDTTPHEIEAVVYYWLLINLGSGAARGSSFVPGAYYTGLDGQAEQSMYEILCQKFGDEWGGYPNE